MLLSRADIRLLEGAGHDRQHFARSVGEGYVQLRNVRGYCFFYHVESQRCRVYDHRPLGCRIYPVMCGEEEEVVVDDLCPQSGAVSKKEIESKANRLRRLLKRIDAEAAESSRGV